MNASHEADDAAAPTNKPSLLGLTRPKLGTRLDGLIDRSFRIEQIYRALYERGIVRFADITELSGALRTELDRRFSIAYPSVKRRHESADGTAKVLFELADGKTIETVDIPDGQRRTLCVSSQAGCALGCRFCVTGYWGAGRDLTAGEIVSQVLALRHRSGFDEGGLNLVFMGMGEPLLNLEELHDALEILFELMSWRRITVSTVGILPALDAMAAWPKRPRLAISLHAPDDDLRSALMPVNQKYPLADLMATLRRYPLRPKERITFEYILIDGVNDGLEQADQLDTLIAGLPAKVNLIPLNADDVLGPDMRAPARDVAERFQARLRARGRIATIRRRRGDDVSAACGQLRAVERAPRGFRRSNLRF